MLGIEYEHRALVVLHGFQTAYDALTRKRSRAPPIGGGKGGSFFPLCHSFSNGDRSQTSPLWRVSEHTAPRNMISGKAYRGINIMLLGLADPKAVVFAVARAQRAIEWITGNRAARGLAA